MIQYSDAIVAGIVAVAVGVGTASVVPTLKQIADPPAIILPLDAMPVQHTSFTIDTSPIDPVTEIDRLDYAQEKLETQSVRIQKIEDKLDLLLGRQGGADERGRQ